MSKGNQLDFLGFGLGLRPKHYETIINTKPKVDWFEIISEDYLVLGGRPHYYLDEIRQDYPIVMHGVSLSIGSCDPLNWDYLQQLRALVERIEPRWVSDHLCWTGVEGKNMHDLLPVPYTEEALNYIAERVQQVQDFLGRQILLENPSTYIAFKDSEMTEWEFLTQLAQRADCLILLDVNNIYVSAFNHKFDPLKYLYHMPKDRVQQFHIAGHSDMVTHIIDTHDHDIIPEVWKLYAKAVAHFGEVSLLIERDDHIPALDEMLVELEQARTIAKDNMAHNVKVREEALV